MPIDFSSVGGVSGLSGVHASSQSSGANSVAQGLATNANFATPNIDSGQPNLLLDGMQALRIPEGLLSGGQITAADVAQLNIDIMNWTTGVTAIGSLRKELNAAKTQLLSEGKA